MGGLYAPPRGVARGSARYYMPLVSATGTLLLVANQEYLIPFEVDSPVAATRIGLEVTTIGSANAVVRLGIRTGRSVDSVPEGLVIDGGTIDGTSLGFKEITINQSLPRGIHWLSAVGQGAPSTQPTVRSMTAPTHPAVSHGAYNATLRVGYVYPVGQAGALLAALAQGSITVATAAPLIVVRAG